MNQLIVVEQRAWIDSVEIIKKNLEELGATYQNTQTITDHYYGNKDSALECVWDEAGENVRIREFSKTDCEVTRKLAIFPKEGNEREHSAATFDPLYKGNLTDSQKYLTTLGYTKHLMDLKKSRQTYFKNGFEICVDELEQFGPAIEVMKRIQNSEEVEATKAELKELLNKIGVKDYDRVSTSITNKVLLSKISKDPKIQEAKLKEELKNLQTRLETSLARRNDAFVHGGDGWHDNTSFRELEREYDLLRSRIEDLQNQLRQVSKK